MADWNGTLAAVRELGRRGIEVHVASSALLHKARWSRHAAKRLSCPNERDPAKYLEWLLEIGRRSPGIALCPTSDDLCFLYSAHAEDLSRVFRVALRPLTAFQEILDKARLHLHALRVGLRTPHSVFPADAAEVRALAASMRWPLLIKQRTQVFSRTLHKGTTVQRPSELGPAYDQFRGRNGFPPEVLAAWPDCDHPMLQEYLPRGSERIYCLAGFIGPGDSWATRAATKVLSHPRQLGIGLLFEHAEVRPDLEQKLLRLCRNVGYTGVFQCEFLEHEGEHLLIDFNPRFYNYLAFDHARGLPQAYLAYLLAIGAHSELDAEIEQARAPFRPVQGMVYRYGLGTRTQLALERLFRRISRDESERWRSWGHGGPAIDPVWNRADPGPASADLLGLVWNFARHPRSFFRANLPRL